MGKHGGSPGAGRRVGRCVAARALVARRKFSGMEHLLSGGDGVAFRRIAVDEVLNDGPTNLLPLAVRRRSGKFCRSVRCRAAKKWSDFVVADGKPWPTPDAETGLIRLLDDVPRVAVGKSKKETPAELFADAVTDKVFLPRPGTEDTEDKKADARRLRKTRLGPVLRRGSRVCFFRRTSGMKPWTW